jgi:hypothetical protein
MCGHTIRLIAICLFAIGCCVSASVASSQDLAQRLEGKFGGQSQENAQELLAAIRVAGQRLDEQIESLVATGILVRRTEKDERVVVQSQDLTVMTLGTKFRVELSERPTQVTRLSSKQADAPLDGNKPHNPTATWIANDGQNLRTHVVLYDGESVFSLRFSDGGVAARAQFGFQQQAALRTAGYPYHPPAMLWQAFPLPTNASELSLQTLKHDGLVIHQRAAGFSAKYYFLGDFDYDLRRVAFHAASQIRPFREVTFDWAVDAGIRYVSRFSVRERKVIDLADARQEIDDLSIEFHQVAVNTEQITDADFTIAALSLPIGTRFEDQRQNRLGKPAIIVWDGNDFRDEAEE